MIDYLRAKGELVSVKIGASRRYPVADLLAFIEARKGVCQ